MRDLKALCADIDGYTLETTIQREVKYTRADIPDNVNPKQVSDVVRIVCELIRRS